MPKSRLKELALALLEYCDTLFLENSALKMLLKTCDDARLRDDWPQALTVALKNPHHQLVAQGVLRGLRAELEAANDEEEVLELLARIPIRGKLN